jgi:Flp pilus assembly protein TadG
MRIPASGNPPLHQLTPPRRATKRWGAATAELAILLPFLCFAFVITIDFARVFYFSLIVTNCARNGAAYGSANTTHALDQAGIKTVAGMDAANLDSTQLNVNSSTDSSTNPTYVTVTVTYPFTTITNYPGVPTSITLTRTVRMAVVPATPAFN